MLEFKSMQSCRKDTNGQESIIFSRMQNMDSFGNNSAIFKTPLKLLQTLSFAVIMANCNGHLIGKPKTYLLRQAQVHIFNASNFKPLH